MPTNEIIKVKNTFFALLLFCFAVSSFAQDRMQSISNAERQAHLKNTSKTTAVVPEVSQQVNSVYIYDITNEKTQNLDQVMACNVTAAYINTVAAVPTTSVITACSGTSITLDGLFSGSCSGGCSAVNSGQFYQSSSSSGPWVLAGTGGTLNVTATSTPVYYYFVFTCGVSSQTSAVAQVVATASPSNDNFANATTITVGAAALTNQSLLCSSLETNENIACSEGVATKSVWYQFTASSNTSYLYIVDGAGAYYVGSAVWTGSVLPTGTGNGNYYCNLVSCQAADYGPNNTLYTLNTVVGQKYYVQIVYSSTDAATFSIQITNTNPGGTVTNQSQNSSTTPFAGCYINNAASNPSCATVFSSCTSYAMTTGNGNMENHIEDAYYSFTTPAMQSTNDANFQNCVLSTCGAGNTDWLIWQVYESTGTYCISSGNLDGALQLGGVGCGSTYILHYLWEPINCSYTSYSPFIDNYQSSSCVLPINLLGFTAKENTAGSVDLYWSTATETNNDFFTLERSTDGKNFTNFATVKGANNSTQTIDYNYTDLGALELNQNTLYYRLSQTDLNGVRTNFNIVDVNFNRKFSVSVYPNPSNGDFNLDYIVPVGNVIQIDLLDMTGAVISSTLYMGSGGLMKQKIVTPQPGVYTLTILYNGQTIHKKIVKL